MILSVHHGVCVVSRSRCGLSGDFDDGRHVFSRGGSCGGEREGMRIAVGASSSSNSNSNSKQENLFFVLYSFSGCLGMFCSFQGLEMSADRLHQQEDPPHAPSGMFFRVLWRPRIWL